MPETRDWLFLGSRIALGYRPTLHICQCNFRCESWEIKTLSNYTMTRTVVAVCVVYIYMIKMKNSLFFRIWSKTITSYINVNKWMNLPTLHDTTAPFHHHHHHHLLSFNRSVFPKCRKFMCMLNTRIYFIYSD